MWNSNGPARKSGTAAALSRHGWGRDDRAGRRVQGRFSAPQGKPVNLDMDGTTIGSLGAWTREQKGRKVARSFWASWGPLLSIEWGRPPIDGGNRGRGPDLFDGSASVWTGFGWIPNKTTDSPRTHLKCGDRRRKQTVP